MKIKFALFLLLLCVTVVSQAEVYRWVDDAGKIHIGLSPPPTRVEDDTDDAEDAEEEMGDVTSVFAAPIRAAKEETPVIIQPAALPDVKSAPPRTVTRPVEHPVAVTTVGNAATPAKTHKAVQPPTKPRSTANTVKKTKKRTVKKHVLEKKKPFSKKLAVKPATKKKIKKVATAKRAAKKKSKKTATAKRTRNTMQLDKEPAAPRPSDERNNEMCGIFTGYVHEYKEKASDCPAALCELYKRSLARYKKKRNAYCAQSATNVKSR